MSHDSHDALGRETIQKYTIVAASEITDTDVLFGRGRAVHMHRGNVGFREQVRQRAATYHAHPADKPLRRDTAMAIIRSVQSKGGRFLRMREETSAGNTASSSSSSKVASATETAAYPAACVGEWETADFHTCMLKVKQALRDAGSSIGYRSPKAKRPPKGSTEVSNAEEHPMGSDAAASLVAQIPPSSFDQAVVSHSSRKQQRQDPSSFLESPSRHAPRDSSSMPNPSEEHNPEHLEAARILASNMASHPSLSAGSSWSSPRAPHGISQREAAAARLLLASEGLSAPVNQSWYSQHGFGNGAPSATNTSRLDPATYMILMDELRRGRGVVQTNMSLGSNVRTHDLLQHQDMSGLLLGNPALLPPRPQANNNSLFYNPSSPPIDTSNLLGLHPSPHASVEQDLRSRLLWGASVPLRSTVPATNVLAAADYLRRRAVEEQQVARQPTSLIERLAPAQHTMFGDHLQRVEQVPPTHPAWLLDELDRLQRVERQQQQTIDALVVAQAQQPPPPPYAAGVPAASTLQALADILQPPRQHATTRPQQTQRATETVVALYEEQAGVEPLSPRQHRTTTHGDTTTSIPPPTRTRRRAPAARRRHVVAATTQPTEPKRKSPRKTKRVR